MTLNKKFVSAKIEQVNADNNGTAWVLIITYSYYGLYEFTDTVVSPTLAAAKDALISIRCPVLKIIDIKGVNI